jgi:hypothetical protein
MVTKRKSDLSKTAGAFRRAFTQLARSLPIPAALRRNWLSVLFPIRLVSQPVALALIALVALVLVLDALGALDDDTLTPATIGGQDVPALACEEDETIGFVGIPDTLVCVHFENYAVQDVGGCVRPAFYVEAADRCVLVAVPPASAPTATVTATATATGTATPTATANSPIGAPSTGAPTGNAR